MQDAKKPWSQFETIFPMDLDLVVNGPLARSAEDLRLVMDIIVSPLTYQRKAIRIRLPEPRKKALSDFKVGVWMDDPLFPPDDDTETVLSDFIDRLARAGVPLVDKKPNIDLKTSYDLRNAFDITTLSLVQPPEIYQQAVDALESDDEDAKLWGKVMTMRHRDWLFLNYVRAFERQQWNDYFKEVDVMLCPVTRIPAHPHDHTPIPERMVRFNEETLNYWDVMGPWISLATVAYLPATVAPAGFTSGGLPVGIQIVGPYLEGLTPIQFAINLEKEIIGPYQLPKGFEG